ncbi:transthyretin-like family domain-containing protein [Ditylenchus destructor]|nr:transthyretin-like family domain-containing protein [Ditylenchus destructor]
MNIVNFLLVTVLALLFAATSAKIVDSVSTRATRAEGILVCGKQPIVGAYVRLFKGNSDDLNDILATATTDSSGRFTIEGDTHSKEGLEAQIDPFLKIYHKCGDEKDKTGYRRFTLRYPRDFVHLGRTARNSYDVGVLNGQIKYPGESRQDSIPGVKP